MQITERSSLQLKWEGSSEWERISGRTVLVVFLGLLAFIPPVWVTIRCEKLGDDHVRGDFAQVTAAVSPQTEGRIATIPDCDQ